MEHTEAGDFLQEICTPLVPDLQMESLSDMHVDPQNIDYIVEMAMQRIKENCTRKEEKYVERRINSNGTVASSSSNIPNGYQQNSDEDVREAKLKHSHNFMSEKLLQSTQMFDYIQDFIQQAENHLISEGFAEDKLQQLRGSYGVDTAADNVWETYKNITP